MGTGGVVLGAAEAAEELGGPRLGTGVSADGGSSSPPNCGTHEAKAGFNVVT